jgi:SAM-dependent methyltransferase
MKEKVYQLHLNLANTNTFKQNKYLFIMEKDLYETFYNIEDKYWWFIGQRYIVENSLKKYYKPNKNTKILDVGCGAGINLQMYSKWGDSCGFDISEEAIKFCEKRGLKVKKSDVMNINYPSNKFDIVSSLGVFYHKGVKDDIRGFRELYRILKPSGRLIFLDCAMMSLMGKHDVVFHTIRRYSRKELKSKLEDAGFEIEKITYINFFIFPLVYIKRKLEYFSNKPPKSEVDEKINPLVNKILTKFYKFELFLTKYISYPFGVNIFAVARKK